MTTTTSHLCFEEYLAYQTELPWISKHSSISVQIPRFTRWHTSRIPDIVVMQAEQWESMRSREAVIFANEPPPLLVVEVTSESARRIDYRAKRSEYAVRDILEYWMIDSLNQKVIVCTLDERFYDCEEFAGNDRVLSPTFPNFSLTAQQVLSATH